MKLALPTAELLEAADYRGFLSVLYRINKVQDSQFSYSYLAKRCRFSSKSFLKDVIEGKKNLSLESANKIISGLPLAGSLGKYFLSLVTGDQREQHRLRKTLRKKETVTAVPNDDVFKAMKWPYIFAALGSSEKGATLDQIAERTRLGHSTIEFALQNLIEKNLVTQKGKRYFANEDTAFFEGLGGSHLFKNFFSHSVEELFDRSRKEFQSKESLFYSMALSVDPTKMAAFRKDLSELLDRYTADIESAEGTRVASLTCGFHLL